MQGESNDRGTSRTFAGINIESPPAFAEIGGQSNSPMLGLVF